MKIRLPCLVGFSPFLTFPFAVLLVISCFSSLILTSVCLKLGPHFTCVSNQFPVEQHTMENSHGREIHYHLARALMHMNYIAGFLRFFEPSVDWDDHPQDLYGRTNRAPHTLGTFIPSCPFHRPHQFPLSSLMEAYRHIWS